MIELDKNPLCRTMPEDKEKPPDKVSEGLVFWNGEKLLLLFWPFGFKIPMPIQYSFDGIPLLFWQVFV